MADPGAIFAQNFQASGQGFLNRRQQQRQFDASLEEKQRQGRVQQMMKLRQEAMKVIADSGQQLQKLRQTQGADVAMQHFRILARPQVIRGLAQASGQAPEQIVANLQRAMLAGPTPQEAGANIGVEALAAAPGEAAAAAQVETATRTAAEPFDIRAEERGRRPQTTLGQLIFDRDMAARQFGEDSAQAKAFDDAINTGGETPDLSDIAGLRKEFTKLSGEFISVQDAYSRVLAAPDTAAGDVGLVFAFMKMLDPGSVVREGEFATAAAAAGLPDRIVALAQRVDTGKRLTSPQVADFKNVARQIYNQQVQGQRLLEGTFRRLSDRQGMASDQVVIPFVRERFTETASDPTPAQARPTEKPVIRTLSTEDEVNALQPGEEFIWGPTGQRMRKD